VNQDTTRTYSVEYNNLWGHEFYTGKFDQSGGIDIGSEAKQTIGNVLDALAFPTSLSRHLIIVDVDPSVTKPGDKLKIPWKSDISIGFDRQPKEATTSNYGGDVAVVSRNTVVADDRAILAHELGHVISFHLTDQEWAQYYKLRGIPSNTPRSTHEFTTSPDEDFAEVYKAVNKNAVAGPNTFSAEDWTIRTRYGLLVPTMGGADLGTCMSVGQAAQQKLLDAWRAKASGADAFFPPPDVLDKVQSEVSADAQVQACRRKNNEQGLLGGPMYVSSVDDATAVFVEGVVERLRAS
jgi:hypothetical protein